MDRLNLKVLVNLSGGNGERLAEGPGRHPGQSSCQPHGAVCERRFQRGSGTGVRRAKAAAQLEQDVKAGALGLKIFKDLGPAHQEG